MEQLGHGRLISQAIFNYKIKEPRFKEKNTATSPSVMSGRYPFRGNTPPTPPNNNPLKIVFLSTLFVYVF